MCFKWFVADKQGFKRIRGQERIETMERKISRISIKCFCSCSLIPAKHSINTTMICFYEIFCIQAYTKAFMRFKKEWKTLQTSTQTCVSCSDDFSGFISESSWLNEIIKRLRDSSRAPDDYFVQGTSAATWCKVIYPQLRGSVCENVAMRSWQAWREG